MFSQNRRFLSVKKWLLRKKHQIELARKRGWKGYWVCLKGTTLLFYPCESQESRTMEAAPKHLIIVDGAIMQPIPEHPKRDYIFCLSTAFGDAYLFQVRLRRWVELIEIGFVQVISKLVPVFFSFRKRSKLSKFFFFFFFEIFECFKIRNVFFWDLKIFKTLKII